MRRVLLLPMIVLAALAAAALAAVAWTSRSATRDLEPRIQEVRRANALAFRLAHLTAVEEQEVLALRVGPGDAPLVRLAAADGEMAAIAGEIAALDLPPR